ncbi:MAG TPA: protein translocase subunit SecF, partial [Candidatus Paceibacterota bacterium]
MSEAMFIVNHRKIFYALSIILVGGSVFAIWYFGLRYGIEFAGGSLLEGEYSLSRPSIDTLNNEASGLGFGNINIQPAGDMGLIVRTRTLNEDEHQVLLKALSSAGRDESDKFVERRFDSIGPVIGKELRRKSVVGIIVVMIMIILYIALAFRKVSKPVSSFKYGLVAVIALIHDVTIPTGVFAVLGRLQGFEVDILFITALLTVLGFSVHDTIVVFDRIRENLRNRVGNTFEETVGASLRQTIARSINTSFTVILVLLALFFFGGETTRYFSLALVIGVIVGTYSSIFI